MPQKSRRSTKSKLDAAYIARNFPRWLRGFEERMINQMAIVRLDVQALHAEQGLLRESVRETMQPIVAHCERLMREKETLRKLHEANQFMSTPTVNDVVRRPVYSFATMVNRQAASDDDREVYIWGPCRFAALHRAGIRCAICGVTP